MGDQRFRKYKHAWFICDRSGFRFPLREAVVEPGTGHLVHYSESDGMWSITEHPQNKPPRKNYDELIALEIARPDRDEVAATSAVPIEVLYPHGS